MHSTARAARLEEVPVLIPVLTGLNSSLWLHKPEGPYPHRNIYIRLIREPGLGQIPR
jgi:hypothetical protein